MHITRTPHTRTHPHTHIWDASLQKGPDVAQKIDIFVDFNRAGHDKSV